MTDDSRTLADRAKESGDAGESKGTCEPLDARVIRRNAKGQLLPGSGRIPKKKSAGQKGNLNAVRNPWATYWRRRALRPEDKWALALVRDYVPELVADKGGEANVSFAQRKVMELAAVARVCWALALVHGNLKAVGRFVSAERVALSDLGLERKAKPVPTLADVMRGGEEGE